MLNRRWVLSRHIENHLQSSQNSVRSTGSMEEGFISMEAIDLDIGHHPIQYGKRRINLKWASLSHNQSQGISFCNQCEASSACPSTQSNLAMHSSPLRHRRFRETFEKLYLFRSFSIDAHADLYMHCQRSSQVGIPGATLNGIFSSTFWLNITGLWRRRQHHTLFKIFVPIHFYSKPLQIWLRNLQHLFTIITSINRQEYINLSRFL